MANTEYFQLNVTETPKAVVILPLNICNKGSVAFLTAKVLQIGGLSAKDVAFFGIDVPKKGTLKKADVVEALTELREIMETKGITTVAIGVAGVWKYFGKKGENLSLNIGRAFIADELIVGTGKKTQEIIPANTYTVVPFLNPVILNMYPNKLGAVAKGLQTLNSVLQGTYEEPEFTKIEEMLIYNSPDTAITKLKELMKCDRIFVDIETTGLQWYQDDLLTISIAPDDKHAYCFPLHNQYFKNKEDAVKMRKLIRSFFNQYDGVEVGHNWLLFDRPFIIHTLQRGRNHNIPHAPFFEKANIDDTMLMQYILKNSTERPPIGLKPLTHKWLGNYDKGIKQNRLISYPLEEVGKYNNYDVIATAKIWEESVAELRKNGLYDIYKKFMQVGKTIGIMKMNGMPIAEEKIDEVLTDFETILEDSKNKLQSFPSVIEAKIALEKDTFNFNSAPQRSFLFFDILGLPVVKENKDTGNPSSDAEVRKIWMSEHEIGEEAQEILKEYDEYTAANKIYSTYLMPIKERLQDVRGSRRVFADFNQHKTITGRLSSSGGLNLQTIPSGSKYGDLIKSLFAAPAGWLLAQADYAALEDRLMANESKDRNKISIFQDEIDAHCLNAIGYFPEEIPDIIEELELWKQFEDGFIKTKDGFSHSSITSEGTPITKKEFYRGVVNSLKDRYPHIRNAGKPYTFGFTYGAGESKYGKDIYNRYWDTYRGVKKYSDMVINRARNDSELVSPFSGLRLFLPAINARIPYIREKEERRAVNFMIQSGNFMMLEALVEIQQFINTNNLHDSVEIINSVHDSVYILVKPDAELIYRLNKVVVRAMVEKYNSTNPPVPLEAELEIGRHMKEAITISNDASIADISKIIEPLQ